MKTFPFKPKLCAIAALLFASTICYGFIGHPINDYYKKHKHDRGMEAKTIPPKAASLFVDEDYPEAIDILQSMTTLKYLNYYGEQETIERYALKAKSAKGGFQSIFNDREGTREVAVFGEKKGGKVRKVIAVVKTSSQFILVIGRGKLSNRQIAYFPALSREIQ